MYIKEIIIFHKLVPGEESLQIHFSSRALFFDIREPTPRPPCFLSRITSLHWILQKDLYLVHLHHKKRLWMDERSLPTPFSILNTNIKYIGRKLRTLLMRQRRPAMLNNLSFHIWSLLRNFSITGFHVEKRDELAPSGMQRYLLGRESELQKIDVAKRKNKWSSTLIGLNSEQTISKLFWLELTDQYLQGWILACNLHITYYRWLRKILDTNCSPLRMFSLDAFWKRTERPSAAISNRKGEIGSPWHNPRWTENSFKGDPLMRTESFDEERCS